MEVIVFEKETYYKMLNEMKQFVREATEPVKEEKKWLSTPEAKELLGCEKSKLQQLRDNNDIVFSQPENSRIIKYDRNSILDYLDRNKNR